MDPVCTADACEGTASVSGVLVEFGEWLGRQRGLAPITVDNYCWNVEQFLEALPQPTQVSVSLLDAGTVTAFMVEYCRDRNTNSVKSMARSVRSFLRARTRRVEHRSGCGARFRCQRVGIWPRCRGRCRLQTSSIFWRSRGIGGCRPPTAATTRSCCCWLDSGCGEARSQVLASTTSTGGPENLPSSARASGLNACRCLPSREKRLSRG